MLSFSIASSMHLGSKQAAACSISVISLVILSEYSLTSMWFSTAYAWKWWLDWVLLSNHWWRFGIFLSMLLPTIQYTNGIFIIAICAIIIVTAYFMHHPVLLNCLLHYPVCYRKTSALLNVWWYCALFLRFQIWYIRICQLLDRIIMTIS